MPPDDGHIRFDYVSIPPRRACARTVRPAVRGWVCSGLGRWGRLPVLVAGVPAWVAVRRGGLYRRRRESAAARDHQREHHLRGSLGARPVPAAVLLHRSGSLVRADRGERLPRADLRATVRARRPTLLWRLLVRMHGDRVALYAMVPIVLDGWLMYVQRISYMENCCCFLWSPECCSTNGRLTRRRGRALSLRALCLGCRGVQVHRRLRHRGRGALLADHAPRTRQAPCPTWLCGGLVRKRDPVTRFSPTTRQGTSGGGRTPWCRSAGCSGFNRAAGRSTSPAAALHLLFAQYDVFAPSFLIALVTLVLALRRLWTCYLERDWRPVTGTRCSGRGWPRRS